jgi:hypothetical protein
MANVDSTARSALEIVCGFESDSRVVRLRNQLSRLKLGLLWHLEVAYDLHETKAILNQRCKCDCRWCRAEYIAPRVPHREEDDDTTTPTCVLRAELERLLLQYGFTFSTCTIPYPLSRPVIPGSKWLDYHLIADADVHFVYAASDSPWRCCYFGRKLWSARRYEDPEIVKYVKFLEAIHGPLRELR